MIARPPGTGFSRLILSPFPNAEGQVRKGLHPVEPALDSAMIARIDQCADIIKET